MALNIRRILLFTLVLASVSWPRSASSNGPQRDTVVQYFSSESGQPVAMSTHRFVPWQTDEGTSGQGRALQSIEPAALQKADLVTTEDFLEYASINDESIHELYFSVVL